MSSHNKLAVGVASAVILASSSAFAQGTEVAASTNPNDVFAWAAAAAGFAVGLAAVGGTLSQGRVASAAVEGISRNPGAAPRIQTAMILGVAMIESIVLFALVVAVLLWSKIQLG